MFYFYERIEFHFGSSLFYSQLFHIQGVFSSRIPVFHYLPCQHSAAMVVQKMVSQNNCTLALRWIGITQFFIQEHPTFGISCSLELLEGIS